MPFEPGEEVKYLNEKGGGTVVQVLEGDMVEVEDEAGFIFTFHASELVAPGKSVLNEPEIRRKLATRSNLHSREVHGNKDRQVVIRDYLMASRKEWTSKDKDFVEIDLHIEEITSKPGYLNDGEKLSIQLDHARNCLEEAIKHRIRRIIFIHGKGTGILRSELRKWLGSYEFVEIQDANYRRYGNGATEVVVRGYYSK